jgi:hypothetical protein
MVAIERKHRRRRHFRRLLNVLGPGLTTGAAETTQVASQPIPKQARNLASH